jgi:hypothetical protein
MKASSLFKGFLVAAIFTFSSCDESLLDITPKSFLDIQINPDEIYIYAGGASYGVRLDPLLNDSIKVDVSVSYSTPTSGKITFIPNEGWFYKANDGFIGVDNFTYTVCHQGNCLTAPIKMHVEQPLTGADCRYELNGEAVQTKKDQPIEIRIFANDIVCPYAGSSINAPEKGTFDTYAYSGNIKNIVYIYYPPKGFVGMDRFKYKIFTNGADLEVYCNITVTE